LRVDRRELLKLAGIGALSGLGGRCAARGRPVTSLPTARRFARVDVAWDRVIRTVVGLRPFRPSGFVVRGEKLGPKTVIHNYGHGGAGITLSWGTAHLAVEEGAKTGAASAAVLGCGAVGLATARVLQRRGVDVTIYARDLPPRTTSNIAGGQWSPFSVSDHDRETPQFQDQLARAARLAHRYYQDMVGPYYGVRWIENYVASSTPQRAAEYGGALADLYAASKALSPAEHAFDVPHVRRFTTMLIEPPVYLNAVLRDFLLQGGKLVVREFADRNALLELREPVLYNCTGIGARALFGDEELTPIRGQLVVLLPQPEIDYITLADGGLYMFPRGDGILLGGTFDRGEWSLDVDEAARKRVVEGHMEFFRRMRG
jgi:D-amino-acid oxidase